MKNYIYLGSAPSDESCIQTTDPDYHAKARAECKKYIKLLTDAFTKHHNREPKCNIYTKLESHDFGSYFEVVATYDSNDEQSGIDAFWLDENVPTNWDSK